eukprot:174908_1
MQRSGHTQMCRKCTKAVSFRRQIFQRNSVCHPTSLQQCRKFSIYSKNPLYSAGSRRRPSITTQCRSKSKECLAKSFPKLADEFHASKNAPLTVNDPVALSTKLWWQCATNPDHVYQGTIANRLKQQVSCSFCNDSGVKLTPAFILEWMTPRNRDIPLAGPFPQFRKLHWRCLLDTRHVWVESVQSRISNKSVCPTCTGLGKLEEQTKEHERINNLSKAEFHPDLNHCAGPAGMLSARDKVWWTCPKKPEHKWQCSYRYRLLNRDTVCKQCQRVGRKRGKEFERRKPVSEQSSFLASEWHSTKNGSLRPTDSIPRHTSIWWQCAVQKDHVWKTKIQNRVYARSGCPYCRGVKALSVVNPKLASEWHPTKNGSKLPSDSLSRQTKVWWRCTQNPEEHVWETSIWRRLENGCPFCRGRRTDSKSAFKVRPDLRNQWHPTLNQLDPDSLLPKSNRPVWWRCPRCRDFSWCSSMRSRIDVSDLVPCYKCFGHEHNRHFLSNVDPLIASLWHPTLNGSLRPSDVLCVSKMSFWWLCPAGHQWMCSVGTTRSRPGCSKCLKVDS